MRDVLINILKNYSQDYMRVLKLQETHEDMSDLKRLNQGQEQKVLYDKYTKKYSNQFKQSTQRLTYGYKVNLQVGSGRWTFVPYISIMNPKVTTTPQDGYYVVYLFRKDMKGVYISLNRGKGSIILDEKQNNAITTYWKNKLGNEYAGKRGFSCNKINLHTNTNKTVEYEERHIIGKYYAIENIPDEVVLMDDLKFMLGAYRELVRLFIILGGTCEAVNNNIVKTMYANDEKLLIENERQLKEQDLDMETEKLSEYAPDCCSDEYTSNDLLEISRDVRSIVNLISMKKLKPPLSIGLFGQWGSGKSFIMKQIMGSIENKRNIDSDEFCKDVVQIEFNAWHYVDTNLLASLVMHILDRVSFYVQKGRNFTNKDYVQPVISPVYRQLEISKNEVDKLSEQEKNTKNAVNDLKTQLSTKENELINTEKKINEFDISTIVEGIKTKSKDELKKYFGNLIDIKEIKDFSAFLEETRKASFTILCVLNNFKNVKIVFNFIAMLFIIFIIASGPEYFGVSNKFLNNTFSWLRQSILSEIIALTPLVKPIGQAVKRVNSASNYVGILAEEQKREIEQEKYILKEKLKTATEEKDKIEKKLKLEKDKLDKLNEEVSGIESGKFLSKFIEKKINSKIYKDQLGIINVIRKDFEFLGEYIKEINSKDKTKTTVDRIILYIDDLDRCAPEKVVEVLQAVHLLLSFELFVVIVAVDTRWVSRCLKEQYKDLFSDEESNESNQQLASTYDYLEKIFQIPIIVKPVDNDAKELYIDGLLEVVDIDDVENEENDAFSEEVAVEENKQEEKLKVEIESITENEKEYKIVEISQSEKDDIKKFVSIIGDTPRTVKRFVNIYRLLKASEIIIDDSRMEVLLVLSIVTGLQHSSKHILNRMMEANDEETLLQIVDDLNRKQIKISSEIEYLHKFISSNVEMQSILPKKLRNIIPKVARYSFNQDIL